MSTIDFAFPTLPEVTEEDLRNLQNCSGPFVVMVFDENLKLLNWKSFLKRAPTQTNSFVGKKKGSISHQSIPDILKNKEDQDGIWAFEVRGLTCYSEFCCCGFPIVIGTLRRETRRGWNDLKWSFSKINLKFKDLIRIIKIKIFSHWLGSWSLSWIILSNKKTNSYSFPTF